VADAAAPVDLRGTAFGFFNLLSGCDADRRALAGLLWDRLGPAFTLNARALLTGLAPAGMAVLPTLDVMSREGEV
jgi:hypothetical protein